ISGVMHAWEPRSGRERYRSSSRKNLRRIVEEDLVDNARVQRSPVNHRTTFDEHAGDLQFTQKAHDVLHIWSTVGGRERQLLDADPVLAQNLFPVLFCQGTNN